MKPNPVQIVPSAISKTIKTVPIVVREQDTDKKSLELRAKRERKRPSNLDNYI